jgi:hypothetical protein
MKIVGARHASPAIFEQMSKIIDHLFTELNIHPVLMEIGAREQIPGIWDGIAPHSTYVGIGPESKLMPNSNVFQRTHFIDEIVTPGESTNSVLYLTNDPVYSTLLRPKPACNSAFLDWPCHLQGESKVNNTTLNALLNRLGLTQVDWLQTNINGIDQQLYESVDDRVRDRILVLDTVLDLVDLWANPGSPVRVYHKFVDDGLWLSRLSSHGFVRMRPESARRIRNIDTDLHEQVFTNQLRTTPGWLFVRFFRTLEALSAGEFSNRDYVLLWAFALLDEQVGYAADITFEYERIFGPDQAFHMMLNETLSRMRRFSRTSLVKRMAKKVLPALVRRRLKPLLLRNAE